MTALIYRRIELVAQGIGDALLIGSAHSAATLRIKAFLTRNDHPFKYLDLDRDADVRDLLERFRVEPAELPVLIFDSMIAVWFLAGAPSFLKRPHVAMRAARA